MNQEEKLIQKWKDIQNDIDAGQKFRAADRLTNMLRNYPENAIISNKLAELYYEAGFLDAAGKYWLWYPSNEYRVVRSVEIYRESMGNSATRILNDIKFRGDKSKLRNFSREILEELEEQSKKEGGFVYRSPFEREEKSDIQHNQNNLGCLLLGIIFFGLFCSSLIVGFYTIVNWISSAN